MRAENKLWPMIPSSLYGISKSLRPSRREWNNLQYPWNIKDHILLRTKDLVHKTCIHKKAQIDEHVIIRGPVFIGNGTQIMPFTTLIGPLWIGDNVFIGHNSLIRDVVLANNAVVGHGSETARSILGMNTTTHYSFIGDSLLGRSVEITANNTLTAYKLKHRPITSLINGVLIDVQGKLGSIIGDFTSLGVNSGVMPGVKIGRHCSIFPGSIITHDVPDYKTARAESAMRIH